MVTTNQISILLGIVEDEGKNTVDLVEKGRALLLVLGQDNFAVRASLELEIDAERLFQLFMIINFAVYGQDVGSFRVVERLRTITGSTIDRRSCTRMALSVL